ARRNDRERRTHSLESRDDLALFGFGFVERDDAVAHGRETVEEKVERRLARVVEERLPGPQACVHEGAQRQDLRRLARRRRSPAVATRLRERVDGRRATRSRPGQKLRLGADRAVRTEGRGENG